MNEESKDRFKEKARETKDAAKEVIKEMKEDIKNSVTGDTAQVLDPVCGMELRPKDAPFTATRDGMTYYFCSQTCHDRFMSATPEEMSSPGAPI